MKIIIFFVFIMSMSFSNSATFVYDGMKLITYGSKALKIDDLNLISKAGRLSNVTQKSLTLSKSDNIQNLVELAIKEKKIKFMNQCKYIERFKEIENGDKLFLKCLKNNKNLDDVLEQASKANKIQRRRITNLEKGLLNSKSAHKEYIAGKNVIKRNIFECSKDNIALMKRGRAPFGSDDRRIILHHLKQQKNGALVELTETEHTMHSNVLHRYVKKGSEITDRNGGFMSFRQKYWKSRAVGCVTRGK